MGGGRASVQGDEGGGVQPGVIPYSALISAYDKGAQWERVKATFEAMKAARAQH